MHSIAGPAIPETSQPPLVPTLSPSHEGCPIVSKLSYKLSAFITATLLFP